MSEIGFSTTMQLLIFITFFGSEMSGEKSDTFDIVLHLLLVMPDYVPVEKRFDILVLTLTSTKL